MTDSLLADPPAALDAATAQAVDLYRSMVLVRAVETQIEQLHKRGRMSGSFHSSIGQEAAAAGVCAALRPADIVTSTHRGHGHAVAKGVPVRGIFAELFGRATGISGGRGGSMHLHHRPSGFHGQNAIVGGGLPWAAGAAWARRRTGGDDIGVAFTGDGAFGQGVFHETLLLARHWGSPTLVVCENNGLAHSMPSEQLFGPPGSIARIVAATGVTARYVDGRDVLEVARVAAELVAEVRTGRPAFLECGVFRVRPHSLADPDYRYRAKDAGPVWMQANDPVALLRARLGAAAAERLDAVDREVSALVAAAVADAEADARTAPSAAFDHVYVSEELQRA